MRQLRDQLVSAVGGGDLIPWLLRVLPTPKVCHMHIIPKYPVLVSINKCAVKPTHHDSHPHALHHPACPAAEISGFVRKLLEIVFLNIKYFYLFFSSMVLLLKHWGSALDIILILGCQKNKLNLAKKKKITFTPLIQYLVTNKLLSLYKTIQGRIIKACIKIKYKCIFIYV